MTFNNNKSSKYSLNSYNTRALMNIIQNNTISFTNYHFFLQGFPIGVDENIVVALEATHLHSLS